MSYREKIAAETAHEWLTSDDCADMRDAMFGKSVLHDIDGTFYMVWSDCWIDNTARDLISDGVHVTVIDLEDDGYPFGLAKAVIERINEIKFGEVIA